MFTGLIQNYLKTETLRAQIIGKVEEDRSISPQLLGKPPSGDSYGPSQIIIILYPHSISNLEKLVKHHQPMSLINGRHQNKV